MEKTINTYKNNMVTGTFISH